MANKVELTGFERYCKRFPNASLEQYEAALIKHAKVHPPIGVPKTVCMPNGVIVAAQSVPSSEIYEMTAEAAKDFFKN